MIDRAGGVRGEFHLLNTFDSSVQRRGAGRRGRLNGVLYIDSPGTSVAQSTTNRPCMIFYAIEMYQVFISQVQYV